MQHWSFYYCGKIYSESAAHFILLFMFSFSHCQWHTSTHLLLSEFFLLLLDEPEVNEWSVSLLAVGKWRSDLMSLEKWQDSFYKWNELSLAKMYSTLGNIFASWFPFIDSCLTFIKSLYFSRFRVPLCQRRKMHYISISQSVCYRN